MTNLERYALSIPIVEWFEYVFCHGCDVCPAKYYCHAQPEGTCCRDNFFSWANDCSGGGGDG